MKIRKTIAINATLALALMDFICLANVCALEKLNFTMQMMNEQSVARPIEIVTLNG